MFEYLDNIFEIYPLIEVAIIWISIGIAALIFILLINRLLDQLSEERRIQISLFKNIIWGVAIPTVGMWAWFSIYNNPFNEYRLITKASTANGFINKVEQDSEVVEYNDSRSVKVVDFFYYEYIFKLPSGKSIRGWGKEYGEIPYHLDDVYTSPYPVVIEYLSDSPNVNRVKGMESGHKTIYEWLRYPILIGAIVLLACTYLGFIIIKAGLKEYHTELNKLKHNTTS